MRTATEHTTDILGQHADIRSLAALDVEHGVRAAPVEQPQCMDLDLARGARNVLSGTRIFVIGAPLELQRRKRGRHLRDAADEFAQCRLERRSRNVDGARVAHDALGVARGRGDAQAHGRRIALGRVEQQLRELGGLAEAQREQSRGQRVERPRVPGLFRAVEPFGSLQRGVGREPDRLVEQQHAVDGPALCTELRHGSGP